MRKKKATVNWWTTEQVARYYQVTPRTIRNWVKLGRLVPVWPDMKKAWKFYPQKRLNNRGFQ